MAGQNGFFGTNECATGPNTKDGELLGRSATSKVAFYGAVPIAQPTLPASGATGPQIATALGALGLVKLV